MLFDAPRLARNPLRWGSAHSDSDDALAFLHTRLRILLRLLGTLFSGVYIAGFLLFAYLRPADLLKIHLHPSKLINLFLAAAPFCAWLWLRRGTRPLRVLQAVDLGAALIVSSGVGAAVALAPGGYHLELGALLGLQLLLVLRAALVPSTTLWTALVGLSSMPAVVLGGYFQAQKSSSGESLIPLPVIGVVLVLWCTALVAATIVVSRVVYGLVTQAREAVRLGQYALREKIGEGGMGAVYRAEHGMLRRATAIKLLLPDRVGAEALARFEREVRLTSQLSHPNTIAIYDYGRTPDGIFYYAMEYLEGESLQALVERDGPQAPTRVVHVLEQISGSLREAHSAGLIHRDIKPGNVLLCTRGGIPEFVKVIDFGLVKRIDGGADSALTQTNAIAGTPAFMAPETVTRPETVDARVDTYALGAVGYFLVTGSAPFSGSTVVEVCSHHLHTPPEPPSKRLGKPVPNQLEAFILRCLAKDPVSRPSDDEISALLAACRDGSAAPVPDRAPL